MLTILTTKSRNFNGYAGEAAFHLLMPGWCPREPQIQVADGFDYGGDTGGVRGAESSHTRGFRHGLAADFKSG